MKSCPIFAASTAMHRVWKESEALMEEFKDVLGPATDGRVGVTNDDYQESDDGDLCWYFSLKFKPEMSVKPKSRWIAFNFIYSRALLPRESTKWPFGQQSLLSVAFDPRPGSRDPGWDKKYMRFRADGQLADPEARAGISITAPHKGRLLEWKKFSCGETWAERAWMFAIPLYSFKNPDDVKKNIISPVDGLIVKGDCKGLAMSNAVLF